MRILLVDDHQMVRDGLKLCLDEHDEYKVVGEASDGVQAVELARSLLPDLIVMDVAMPTLNGIEAAKKILTEIHPAAKIICLSMHSDREYISEAFRVGVVGYMLKSSAFKELVEAIGAIAEGRKYISPAIAEIVVDNYLAKPAENPEKPFEILTPRERQVLHLLADGLSAKKIGNELGISPKTVHAFRSQIMLKLGIDSLPELTKYAIRHGLSKV